MNSFSFIFISRLQILQDQIKHLIHYTNHQNMDEKLMDKDTREFFESVYNFKIWYENQNREHK